MPKANTTEKEHLPPHITLPIPDISTLSDDVYQAHTKAKAKVNTDLPEKERAIPMLCTEHLMAVTNSYALHTTIPDIVQAAPMANADVHI